MNIGIVHGFLKRFCRVQGKIFSCLPPTAYLPIQKPLNSSWKGDIGYRNILKASVGTEELAHLEIIGSIVSQLTSGEGAKSFDRYGVGDYYVDHSNAVYPQSAAGAPFTAAYLQSKGDPIADLTEDMAAEQKARATYDNILRLSDDQDVNNVIKFLREREVVHFQRFGELLNIYQSKIQKA